MCSSTSPISATEISLLHTIFLTRLQDTPDKSARSTFESSGEFRGTRRGSPIEPIQERAPRSRGIARLVADRLMVISLSHPVVIHPNKLCGAMH